MKELKGTRLKILFIHSRFLSAHCGPRLSLIWKKHHWTSYFIMSLTFPNYKSHNLLVVMDKEKHSVVTFTFQKKNVTDFFFTFWLDISNFQPYKRHFRFFLLEKVFQTTRNSGKWLTIVDPTKLLFGNSKIGSAVSREKLMKTCLLKNSPAQNEVTLVNN